MDRDLCGHRQKIETILTRVVGYTANFALPIKQIIGEGRNRTHVDSAQYQRSTTLQILEGGGYQFARGRKDNGCVESRRRIVISASHPLSAQFGGEFAMLLFPGGDHNLDSPITRNLNAYVTCGTKAIDAQPVSGLQFGKPQCAETDDARTQQRRSCQSAKAFRNRVCELLGRCKILRVTTINSPTGVERIGTQILFPAFARLALSAGAM